jgi:hypothetical protein
MTDIKNQEHIDDLRRRLYERGGDSDQIERHRLTPREIEVSRGWGNISGTLSPEQPQPQVSQTIEVDEGKKHSVSAQEGEKPKRRYRLFILLASFVLLFLAIGVSSVYLFFGGNQISADNIALTLSLPDSVAGGEVVPIQVSVANQNSVAIESPILIINYPPGTRSSEEGNRELYEDRLPLEEILSGQARNVPLRAIFYGEQGEEKEVRVAIEYRVKGSSGAFYKEAETQKLTISSAPVAVRIAGVESISSGQTLELVITVESNSDAVQKNVLVNASYPDTFSFDEAEPEPAYGNNSWIIPELSARGTAEIRLKGLVTGLTSESAEVEVKVGTPQLNNQFLMGSVLSQSNFSFRVDKPFTGVLLSINGDSDGTAIIEAGDEAEVKMVVENSLSEPMRNLRVVAKPTGNLIRDDKLVVQEGYYDASARAIRYDDTNIPSLAEIRAGDERSFTFRVKPDEGQTTAGFTVLVEVYAKRGDEAAESLIGTATAEAKYASTPLLGSQVGYSTGSFTDSGAVPPVVGTKTSYTVTLVVEAGVNDMTSGIVTASLPNYVSWLEQVKGDGAVSYDAEKKQIRWVVGDISAGKKKSIDFQVELLPTASQVGRTAVLVGAQELRTTDRFTGTTLRAVTRDLTNELSTELGFVRDNGTVRAKSDD